MINKEMHLREDLFEGKEKSPTRSGFGKGAVEGLSSSDVEFADQFFSQGRADIFFAF